MQQQWRQWNSFDIEHVARWDSCNAGFVKSERDVRAFVMDNRQRNKMNLSILGDVFFFQKFTQAISAYYRDDRCDDERRSGDTNVALDFPLPRVTKSQVRSAGAFSQPRSALFSHRFPLLLWLTWRYFTTFTNHRALCGSIQLQFNRPLVSL